MVLRHIVPNLLGIVVDLRHADDPDRHPVRGIPELSGLGVQSPLASLGALVADGASDMQAHPYLLIVPAIFLAVIVYCFNYLGDGLRDAA